MKLEEGKFYKTRDGRKQGPYRFNFKDVWQIGDDYRTAVFENGRYHRGHETDGDLIEEWIDEPVQDGPVRERLVREIVPGVYGRIEVLHEAEPGGLAFRILSRSGGPLHRLDPVFYADDWADLAMIASQLAEALREGARVVAK